MTSFMFDPERRPYPRWMGPFSPARGIRSGFRFHQGRLGTWVEHGVDMSFWPMADCEGADRLTNLVRRDWGGGRVLLLPTRLVVKPLQGDHEVGRRVVIGRFRGPVVLKRPDGSTLDLNAPGHLQPGDPWPGPKTTGLECAIQSDGSLICQWYHPTGLGRDTAAEQLHGADRKLAIGFKRARPGDAGGRVRVTANGHVITNRQTRTGGWMASYVGRIDPASWTNWSRWIGRDSI